MKRLMLGAVLAASTMATPALAQNYNPVSNGGPSANFQYGFNTGAGFTPFTSYFAASTCPRIAGTSCFLRSPGNGGDFLGTYFVTQDTATQGAFLYATDATLHPGPGGNELAVVRFIAPTAGRYDFKGFFRGVDAPNSGNGVLVTPNNGNALVLNNGVNNAFGFGLTLGAGAFVDFAVSNNNGYSNDTTGLNLNVAAVPEPASWGLMILGFGLAGYAMRRRSARVAFAA